MTCGSTFSSTTPCGTNGGTNEISTPLLKNVDIPVYLGCDWENVPLHLPSTFIAWKGLAHNPNVQMGMLDKFGLTWPWESLHVEALAWYDHWLKGRDTGILDGDPIRYALPGADGWRGSPTWPPAADYREFALRADGSLDEDEGAPGARRLHGARRGPRPGEGQRDRPARHAHLDHRRRSMPTSTSSATSNCGSSRRPPPPTRRGSPRCRTSLPTARSPTSLQGGCAPACARSTRRPAPQAPPHCRAAFPLPCRSAKTSSTESRWCPMPAASQRVIAFGWCSPATTRIPRRRPS